MSNKKMQYGIFDGDELLAKGSNDYMRSMFGIYAYQYVYSGKLYKCKYQVRKIGKFTGNKIHSDKVQVTKDRKEAIENAVLMMRLHGNVYANDPEEYRTALSQQGISYTYRPCIDGIGYILERS